MQSESISLSAGLLIGLIIALLAILCAISHQRRIAIDANVARWVIDGKTGERTLEYGCDD